MIDARIRPTTDQDADALRDLVASVAHERRYIASTRGFTLEQTRSYIAHVRTAGGVQLVAERDGRLVGWVDITPGPFEGLSHGGRLGMGVAAAARGAGLGPALLDAALHAGFAVLERIELEVFASNTRATALYLRAGFVEEGRRRCARKLDEICDDIVMMGLLRDEWRTRRGGR